MKKLLFVGLTVLILIVVVIFQTGCKKSNTNPVVPIQQQGKIIYLSYLSALDTIEIWTANYDGSDANKINIALPANVKLDLSHPPKMSPDHKMFYITGSLTNGLNTKYSIFSCNIDGSNLKEIVSGDTYSFLTLSDTYDIGQQGKILYAQNSNNSLEIWTANNDGTNPQKINFTLPIYVDALTFFPKISPDGKTVFFVALGVSATYTSYIYECNIATGTTQSILLGNQNANIDYATIDLGCIYTSGKSNKILYLKESSSYEIWSANLDGTGLQKINISLAANIQVAPHTPKVSPDGKIIFFAAGDGGIYSCNIDGSNVRLVIAAVNSNNGAVIGDAF